MGPVRTLVMAAVGLGIAVGIPEPAPGAPVPLKAEYRIIFTPAADFPYDTGPSPSPQTHSDRVEYEAGAWVEVSARADGGVSGGTVVGLPLAEFEIRGTGSGASGDEVVSLVEYEFAVLPIPGATPPGPLPGSVPVIATAYGSAELVGPPLRGGGLARIRLRTPGNTHLDHGIFVGGLYTPVADTFSRTVRFDVPSGSTGVVELDARGGFSPSLVPITVRAVVDPVIRVDPVATFESGGATLSYADVFQVEFPDTIGDLAPESRPVPAVPGALAAAAGVGLGALGLRFAQRRRPGTGRRRATAPSAQDADGSTRSPSPRASRLPRT